MPKLKDIVAVCKSKNAGPFELTIDAVFSERETFERVKAAASERAAATLDESIKSENPKGNDRSAAGRVGALLAERAKAKGLDKLYFDRFSGSHKYLFHGRVKALVDGVREGGITV